MPKSEDKLAKWWKRVWRKGKLGFYYAKLHCKRITQTKINLLYNDDDDEADKNRDRNRVSFPIPNDIIFNRCHIIYEQHKTRLFLSFRRKWLKAQDYRIGTSLYVHQTYRIINYSLRCIAHLILFVNNNNWLKKGKLYNFIFFCLWLILFLQ